jgi:asparagine synthase (glutamine-hydrolysing)
MRPSPLVEAPAPPLVTRDSEDPILRIGADAAGRPVAQGSAEVELGQRVPGTGGGDDGVHAGWRWDGAELQAFNDRFGFFPLYYYASDREIIVSSSIVRMLETGAPTELDDAAMAVFLRTGYFVADDTPFRHIKTLPPQGRLTWGGSRWHVASEPRPYKPSGGTRDAAIDGFIDRFRAAMRKRAPLSERFAVPLSGGHDSRHILLELCRTGRRPMLCVSMPHFLPRVSDDPEIASMVASALGVPHRILEQPPSRLGVIQARNLKTGFCADEHKWAMRMGEVLAREVDTVYDGIGGDVLAEGTNLTRDRLDMFGEGKFVQLAERMFWTRESALRSCLQPAAYRRFSKEAAIESLVRELRKYADAPNPVSAYFFWTHTRREISLIPFRILSGVRQVHTPFLDGDLVDFMYALPPEHLMDHEFHTAALQRAFPEMAHVPFEVYRVGRTSESQGHFRRFARELAWYCLAAPSTMVNKKRVVPRLVRAMLNGDYRKLQGTAPDWVAYLLHLEQVASTPPRDGASRRLEAR